ncbi:MAG: phage tail tip lysozyme [Prochlorococcaceae cyanobacterium]
MHPCPQHRPARQGAAALRAGHRLRGGVPGKALSAGASPRRRHQHLQSWLSFLCREAVSAASQGRIHSLSAAEACGFIGCLVVETGSPDLAQLDVIEAGSGAGRGAMQYTGARRTAYERARNAAQTSGIDTGGNDWQQRYFAEVYAGLHDPSAGSPIGWSRVFEDRPAGMNAAEAAAYWTGSAAACCGYFRPAVPHLQRRQQEAPRVWGL